MTLTQFREYLKALVDEIGLRELGRQRGVEPATISRVVNGKEIPSDYFLSKFGFKRRITIVKK